MSLSTLYKCPVRRDSLAKNYCIVIVEGVQWFEPSPSVGTTLYRGQPQERSFPVNPGDEVEFIPGEFPGQLTWTLAITDLGLKAVAKVKHEKPGFYVLPEIITTGTTLKMIEAAQWRDDSPKGQYWDETMFRVDLSRVGIVHGVYPWAYLKILQVEGEEEIEIAEGTPIIPPTPSTIIDYVASEMVTNPDDDKIDFFASKIRYVKEGEVLARKIPGNPGVSGKNVKGQDFPVPPQKDPVFVLKKNVRLSEDGLEVIATRAGLPIHSKPWIYSVENVYIVRGDVDLAMGSVDFPGDVYVDGNVQDGLHVYSGGKVEIRGSVSKGDIRAENGLIVRQSLMGSKVVVGEHYLNRTKLLQMMKEMHERLSMCLTQTEVLINHAHAQPQNAGQYLKLILEQKHPELAKLAAAAEKFVIEKKDIFIDQQLIVAVRTAKHFLTSLGPLDVHAYPFLQRVNQAFAQLVNQIILEVPEKLESYIGYAQGAVIECAGSLECQNGVYNSTILAGGDVVVKSVCRGGIITSGGNVKIKELGGAGVSITTVQITGNKRMRADYCHANVTVIVDKEMTRIDEECRALEVYRENGRLQVEKFRAK